MKTKEQIEDAVVLNNFEQLFNLNKAIRVCGDMQKAVLAKESVAIREMAAATLLRCFEMCDGLAVDYDLPTSKVTTEEVAMLRDLAEKVDWA